MKRSLALLALLAAFPPLSTDMYLPAIPLLVKLWQQPLTTVNLTLVGFFTTYCLFLLIYGPLSDRYGRRPPLLTGLLVYITACLLCAAADSVQTMIAARILQGAGAAAASSIAFAICKDRFTGGLRQRIFIQLGIIVAAAPMIAPIIGGWIIETLSWRFVFLLQVLLGCSAFTGVWLMDESLVDKSSARLAGVFKSYARLVRNRPFFLLTLASGCLGAPFFAYIAISSDIYITTFGYSEKSYGYIFGLNASAFMLAPVVFSRLARHFQLTRLLTISYIGVLASAGMITVGVFPQPHGLTVSMWLLTFSFAFGRPPGNNLLLEQVEQDAGAASSLMIFVFFIIGAGSMWFASFDWHDKIRLLGLLGLGASALTLSGWLLVRHYHTVKIP